MLPFVSWAAFQTQVAQPDAPLLESAAAGLQPRMQLTRVYPLHAAEKRALRKALGTPAVADALVAAASAAAAPAMTSRADAFGHAQA